MNSRQKQKYGKHIWWQSIGFGPQNIGPYTWTSGCAHCNWKSGSLREGNALAKAARVKAKAMQHVREAHPEVLEAHDIPTAEWLEAKSDQ